MSSGLPVRDSFTSVINGRTNLSVEGSGRLEFDHRFIRDDVSELLPSKLPRGFTSIRSCSGRPVYQKRLQLRSRHGNHHRSVNASSLFPPVRLCPRAHLEKGITQRLYVCAYQYLPKRLHKCPLKGLCWHGSGRFNPLPGKRLLQIRGDNFKSEITHLLRFFFPIFGPKMV